VTRSRWAEENEEHEHVFALAITDTTGEPIAWVCECGAKETLNYLCSGCGKRCAKYGPCGCPASPAQPRPAPRER